MDDERKPDPSLLKLAVYHHKAASVEDNRCLNFKEWMNKRTTSRASGRSISSRKVQSPVELPTLPISSPKPQTQAGQLMIKDEPLTSAAQDWIGPTKDSSSKIHQTTHPPSNKVKLMLQFSSGNPNLHNKAPSLRPSPQPNPTPTTNTARLQLQNLSPNQDQRLKLLPKTSIPTRPRSFLKSKARDDEQSQQHDTPSSRASNGSMMMMKHADNLFCHLCQKSCSSPLTMQMHLKGRPHKAKMEYKKMERNTTATRGREGRPRCELCEIWCSDVGALDMHFKGQKHKSKIQESQLCKKRGREKSSKAPVICELCSVPCMNQDLFEMHLKGRQHAAKEELKRRGFH